MSETSFWVEIFYSADGVVYKSIFRAVMPKLADVHPDKPGEVRAYIKSLLGGNLSEGAYLLYIADDAVSVIVCG